MNLASMTAAVLHGKEDVRIEQVPIPQAGDGEVVIKIGVALTCGTDLKVFLRGYHAKMIVPPALFGHELAGVISEAGPNVTRFFPGTRVVAINSAPCGECFFCERNQENLCEDLLFNNGAYAEYIGIPPRIVEKNMLVIPDHVSFEAAALTEPLACAVRGLEETAACPGDHVVVIGGGALGLMLMEVAAVSGMHVMAVVKRDEQVRAARKFGASDVIQIKESEDPIAAVRAHTPGGRGGDVVIEAVGRPQSWQWAVKMVRNGGVVNFFGGCATGTKVELDTNLLHYSEITLKATFHHTPASCRRAFALITEGKIKSADYITGEAPLRDLTSVLRQLSNRGSDIKTAIRPNGMAKFGMKKPG